MLLDEIQQRIRQAMHAGDAFQRDLLRVALGELQTEQTRTGELSEDKARQLIRKMIKSNRETIDAGPGPEVVEKLHREIAVLEELLPRTLDEDAVLAALEPVADPVRAAGNDGQATGVAMKHLKSIGANVEGATVASAVRRMRTS